jgi:hypothetical protein
MNKTRTIDEPAPPDMIPLPPTVEPTQGQGQGVGLETIVPVAPVLVGTPAPGATNWTLLLVIGLGAYLLMKD